MKSKIAIAEYYAESLSGEFSREFTIHALN